MPHFQNKAALPNPSSFPLTPRLQIGIEGSKALRRILRHRTPTRIQKAQDPGKVLLLHKRCAARRRLARLEAEDVVASKDAVHVEELAAPAELVLRIRLGLGVNIESGCYEAEGGFWFVAM